MGKVLGGGKYSNGGQWPGKGGNDGAPLIRDRHGRFCVRCGFLIKGQNLEKSEVCDNPECKAPVPLRRTATESGWTRCRVCDAFTNRNFKYCQFCKKETQVPMPAQRAPVPQAQNLVSPEAAAARVQAAQARRTAASGGSTSSSSSSQTIPTSMYRALAALATAAGIEQSALPPVGADPSHFLQKVEGLAGRFQVLRVSQAEQLQKQQQHQQEQQKQQQLLRQQLQQQQLQLQQQQQRLHQQQQQQQQKLLQHRVVDVEDGDEGMDEEEGILKSDHDEELEAASRELEENVEGEKSLEN